MSLLCRQNIHKTYGHGSSKSTPVLDGFNLSIQPQETVALVGPSGVGKSTLLHIAGLLDTPTQGEVLWNDQPTPQTPREQALFRHENIGFVYQQHHLLREFTALENVMMGHRIRPYAHITNIKQAATALLEDLGLGHRLHHVPSALSGGEQQRVALARAMVHQPQLILADEPTGNLDPASTENLWQLLEKQRQKTQSALLMVTHDMALAKKCDRMIELR